MDDKTDRPGQDSANLPLSVSKSLASAQSLVGIVILVVEDEALLAFDLRDSLQEAGAIVIGPVPSLPGAIRAANDEHIDAAILDIDLQGQDVFPAADILLRRGVPFVFHSGHGSHSGLPAQFEAVPICPKPACPDDVLSAVAELIHSYHSTGGT